MIKYFFIFILFIVVSSHKMVHDVHVSVTDIAIDQNGQVKLTSKIFYDDLQLAMGLVPGEELPKKYKGADDVIAKFLSKNLKIKFSQTPLIYTYKSSKASLPAIWAYAEAKVDMKSLPNEIAIENIMFTSIYNDQVNMVNITLLGKTHHLALNKKKSSGVVKWR